MRIFLLFKVKNYNLNVTEVRDSDFKNAFPGIFNFTVGILKCLLSSAWKWKMSYTKKTKLIRIFQVGLEKGWKNNFLKTKPLFIPPCLQCSFKLLFMFILLFSHFLFILVTLWRPKNLFLEIKGFIISYFYFKNSTFSLSPTSFFLSKFIPVV